ncbi:glycosyltransferase [Smaragdicoccus niigatensis]|uniref:glycosyltransferase n=1 Tax=Smaragdicoccus niigatensis TaxID=359359 RepID=UPI000377681A|nr:glycosyltransferase [Smaragdicoccus niigatensis]
MSDTGGADKVFSNIRACLPAADAVCLWDETDGDRRAPVTETRLAQSWLRGRKNLALPAMPVAWKQVPLHGYDTVVALSHAFAHHLAARAARSGRRAFSYVHTPARYIWAPDVDPRGRRPLARIGAGPLRVLDRRGVEPRVSYAANSQYIQRRIERCWGVEATVIYPPVNVERIASVKNWHHELDPAEDAVFHSLPTDGFILGASRLVKYKRVDRAIELGDALGLPVVIAGGGPAMSDLRTRATYAKVPVYFTGRVSDEMLYALYQAASLFVFLGIEDFGIMPVESIAAGTPVLINAQGGARESVLALGGGVEFDPKAGAGGLVEAAELAMACDMAAARSRLDMFSVSTFQNQILEWTGSH